MKVKLIILFIITSLNQLSVFSQETSLNIQLTDSINLKNNIVYLKSHKDINTAEAEIQKFNNSLDSLGYFNHKLISLQKKKDSLIAIFKLYKKIDSIIIQTENEKLHIRPEQLKIYLSEKTNELTKDGHPFSEAQLNKQIIKDGKLYTELIITDTKKRTLDSIKISGYSKFPRKYLNRFANLKLGETFNPSKIEKQSQNLKDIPFIEETKSVETLFTKDSTTLFLYLKKKSANYFDGYIGFGNNEANDEFQVNGTVDIQLLNNLNKGELLKIFWKNNGSSQSNFEATLSIPYIFNTPFTFKQELNILRQDSVFSNTTSQTYLTYQLRTKHQIGLSYLNTSSTSPNNLNTTIDFKKNFFGITYQYNTNQNRISFTPRNEINLNLSTGNREAINEKSNQTLLDFKSSISIPLKKDRIVLRNSTNILFSEDYLNNELFFIGGINSIRGFSENSIPNNLNTVFNLEYHKILNNKLYLNSITDFAYYKNNNSNTSSNLYSIGFGIGLLGNNNLFKLNYAIGFTNKNQQNLNNSKIHVSYTTFF